MTPVASTSAAAASLPAEVWTWGAVAELILSGLAVVMGVLLLLSALTALMGRFFVALEARRAAQTAAPQKTAAASAPETDEALPQGLIAVLAAAAAEILNEDVRIVRVRRRPDIGSGWAVQGRMSIHSSHQLRQGGPH